MNYLCSPSFDASQIAIIDNNCLVFASGASWQPKLLLPLLTNLKSQITVIWQSSWKTSIPHEHLWWIRFDIPIAAVMIELKREKVIRTRDRDCHNNNQAKLMLSYLKITAYDVSILVVCNGSIFCVFRLPCPFNRLSLQCLMHTKQEPN